MITPKAQGTEFYHYQWDYKKLGRKRARATDSDSGRNWAYFFGVTDEQVDAWLAANNWEEIRINSSYDCTGKRFARCPYVRRVGNRVLVTHSWGYDV